MELKNYYRLTFDNQQEYFVESQQKEIASFLSDIAEKGLFSGNAYIVLQLKDGDPMYMKSNKLFSVQKAHAGVIGAQTKLWRLV